jgi:hypothetical protein
MRIERRLVATRVDHKLTLTELAEFIRECEAAGLDPGSWVKVQSTVRGYARTVEIVPDPSRGELGPPGGGTDGQ